MICLISFHETKCDTKNITLQTPPRTSQMYSQADTTERAGGTSLTTKRKCRRVRSDGCCQCPRRATPKSGRKPRFRPDATTRRRPLGKTATPSTASTTSWRTLPSARTCLQTTRASFKNSWLNWTSTGSLWCPVHRSSLVK